MSVWGMGTKTLLTSLKNILEQARTDLAKLCVHL